MALLVLIILGGLLGWIASIISRTEATGAILRQMGIGMAVSLISGSLANKGSPIGGLLLFGLGTAVVATIAALAAYYLVHIRRTGIET